MKPLSSKRSFSRRLKVVFLVFILILIVIVVGAFYYFYSNNSSNRNDKILYGDSSDSTKTNNSQPADGTSADTDAKKSTTNGIPIELAAPSGSFVSSHHVNTTNNTMNSICIVTPGSTCEISFAKDGLVKKLPMKTAGGDGSVNWDWTLKDIGISPGSWRIKAISSFQGSNKSTDDPMSLEVGS